MGPGASALAQPLWARRWQCQQCTLPTHPSPHPYSTPHAQVLPLVVQSLPMIGQRATYIRAFLWAMPERCQQFGVMVSEAVGGGGGVWVRVRAQGRVLTATSGDAPFLPWSSLAVLSRIGRGSCPLTQPARALTL